MAEIMRHHPLADRAFALSGVTLSPAAAAERVSLRAGKEALAALAESCGVPLPSEIGSTNAESGTIVLKLGPDEWLIIAASGSNLAARLSETDGYLFSAVDVSHRNTAIIVEGPKAASTLNSGCPRDLSLKAFPVGACARTLLAKSEIVLVRESEHRFRVECWRSFSDYVWNYLADAARSA